MIPEGMRDVLPAEAESLQMLVDTLHGRFAAYGYWPVRTPTLEFAETFEALDDDTLRAGYRVFDERGRVLLLRTDMTVPVARLAVTRCREKPLPLRFSYIADSYRLPAPNRREDGQFTQAGVELLGAGSAAADAELVVLLCDALRATGLRDFRVALGTVAFHASLIDGLRLPNDQAEAALDALAERDYPLLESILSNAGVDPESVVALQRAIALGGGDEALSQARRLAGRTGGIHVLDRLDEVGELVEEAGFGDFIDFDVGLTPDIDYYTGLLIEAYAPEAGFPVATGGRYDELLAQLGWDIPGAGFAISMDRLHAALEHEGLQPVGREMLQVAGGFDEPELCADLRAAGYRVAAAPAGAEDLQPPSLAHRDGGWVLSLPGREPVRGSLRDIRRELGLT